MTHYVYIAASNAMLSWTNADFGRSAIKVGTTWNPADRELYLSGKDPHFRRAVPSCCGCRDWKVVSDVEVASKNVALDLERRLKAAFDPLDVYGRHVPPFPLSSKSAGESDLVLLPAKPLVGVELSALDDDVRSLYINGRSRMYAAVRAAAERSDVDDDHVDDEQREIDRERDLHLRGERETRAEDQDRAARAAEDGAYYQD